jgi:succinate dehydrogenase / fumarate reductase, iron-sulfur subunit
VSTKGMHITLKVWRQSGPESQGDLATYEMDNVSPDSSFLELIDLLNEKLEGKGENPIAFDHDCREGICGACSMFINGQPHGPERGTTACQLHMRSFEDGAVIVVEPWRARAFPIVKDLVVDRSAFDRIIEAGGYISVKTGSAPEANLTPIPKHDADTAMDAAACIGCGACVAACKNASAMLFLSAKVSHLGLLPQGKPEQDRRVLQMLEAHDREGFGACSNTGACEAECPKEISIEHIARLNRSWLKANLLSNE